ncbi:26S proteasome non-ATPase regulatory subunit 10-like [Branchiostoma lanceolatum]|uniref:26S proteasome non-ATPase regulatory subunit 10-like n=1 Tax=Branchiostoma lanceolatum TaxID=7740 RepID=UPI003456C7E2
MYFQGDVITFRNHLTAKNSSPQSTLTSQPALTSYKPPDIHRLLPPAFSAAVLSEGFVFVDWDPHKLWESSMNKFIDSGCYILVDQTKPAAKSLSFGGSYMTPRGRADQTSLHVASMYGQTEMAELLIEYKAYVNARDGVSRNNSGLISPNLNPDRPDQDTTLHKAAYRGHTGTCELLIRHGADATTRNRPDQDTPLHQAAEGGHTGTCELLNCHGTDGTDRDGNQFTPLHLAAEKGHTGTCELLIRHGADVTARTKHGSTALHEAAEEGHTGTCELLIRHGADLTARDKGLPRDKQC